MKGIIRQLLESFAICFIVIGVIFIADLGVPSEVFIQDVCKQYNITCKIERIEPNGLPNAYANLDNNVIYIVGDIGKRLSKRELESVLLHEIGHIVLKHKERYQQQIKLNPQSSCAIRRAFEYEADMFSFAISSKNFRPTLMDNALDELVPTAFQDMESCTHPSIKSRIELLKRLEGSK